jgi:hypothetical protein
MRNNRYTQILKGVSALLYRGIALQGKAVREGQKGFVFRVKIGDYEVEIEGTREEVLKTVGELPGLTASVGKAFEGLKPRTETTVTVKKEAAREEAVVQKYPKIVPTENCGEAVLRILESDWGKWRPRTVTELKAALRANELDYSGRILPGVLLGLVRQGKVRRWKTDAGQVYILAEEEVLG